MTAHLLRRVFQEQWSKTLTNISTDTDSVTAYFKDGTSATGRMIIGCDGSRSRVRQILAPSNYENFQLPVRLLGVGAVFPEEQARKMRALDPYFLQGGDPQTNAFLYHSCKFDRRPLPMKQGLPTY